MPYTLTPRYVGRAYPGYSTFQLDVEYDWPSDHQLTRAVFRIKYKTDSPSASGVLRVGNLDENGNIQNKVNIWTGTLYREDLNFVLDFTVGGAAISAINARIASGDGRIAFELHNGYGYWGGALTTHTGFQTDGTFFEPDSSAFTVIENGVEIAAMVEGESYFDPFVGGYRTRPVAVEGIYNAALQIVEPL